MASEARNQGDGNQEEDNQGYALTPSPFVEALIEDPAQPAPDIIVLQGLLGRSKKEGYWRIYFSSALKNYAEFSAEDALYSDLIPKEESPLGLEATRVWLKQEAEIVYSPPTRLLAPPAGGGYGGYYLAPAQPAAGGGYGGYYLVPVPQPDGGGGYGGYYLAPAQPAAGGGYGGYYLAPAQPAAGGGYGGYYLAPAQPAAGGGYGGYYLAPAQPAAGGYGGYYLVPAPPAGGGYGGYYGGG